MSDRTPILGSGAGLRVDPVEPKETGRGIHLREAGCPPFCSLGINRRISVALVALAGSVAILSMQRILASDPEVHAVGYLNVDFPAGYTLMANPLSLRQNTLEQIWPDVPEGTRLAKFDGQSWWTNEFTGGIWTYPAMTLSPGEGAVLYSPNSWRHTWGASIAQGELQVLVPQGGSLRSSLVPQTGPLSGTLGFPEVTGTKVYTMNRQGELDLLATSAESGWDPAEPILKAGDAFYLEAPAQFVWNKPFTTQGDGTTLPESVRITVQPQSLQVRPGDSLSLSVEAESTDRLFYQWQLNGNDVYQGTEPTLRIASAETRHLGEYWVKVWDDRTWVWSQIVSVQFAEPAGPYLTIRADDLSSGIVLRPLGLDAGSPVIEVSSDLVNWLELTDGVQLGDGAVLDRFPVQQNSRFYRFRTD